MARLPKTMVVALVLFEFFAERGLDWREFRPAIAFDLLGRPLGAATGGGPRSTRWSSCPPRPRSAAVVGDVVVGHQDLRRGRLKVAALSWILTNQIPETISARLL
jgi:hypothetical protein